MQAQTSRYERRGIFVSYRRVDSSPWTGRLVADLRKYFGDAAPVYFDIDSSRPAQDFVAQLEKALAASRVVIAVLGPQWLGIADGSGRRRLDDPADLVRVELETALKEAIALVPVLTGGATMPPARELPPTLRTLARLQAVRLADEDWAYDFGRLLETLENHGVIPAREAGATTSTEPVLTTVKRYQRTLPASRRRAFDALTGAVELLRYSVVATSPEASSVTFHARRGAAVTAEVVDAEPGHSTVVLKMPSLKTGAVAGGSLALALPTNGASLLIGPALWAWQRRFASGFFDNVQSVLEGRGVGEDSSLLPGIHAWRNRKREI
ncbi:toll/interleukin-1 receptor domain-containing protein [Streptomyces sp. ISL-11]|uniref:toll/interleukin-1 receptor domain-containing protein n=1 Tax=Streptomyces sp. ISL-11 TaxID=2819174 RepID=UPI001BEAA3EF|nr:toll/interleukin-1 receptor domain-containing protein [Streptomyces sp. ISL-11]MBT2385836.1 toll/interleukin-1 receptor domain-containing protein [Streptomyces sp. ISL-11]